MDRFSILRGSRSKIFREIFTPFGPDDHRFARAERRDCGEKKFIPIFSTREKCPGGWRKTRSTCAWTPCYRCCSHSTACDIRETNIRCYAMQRAKLCVHCRANTLTSFFARKIYARAAPERRAFRVAKHAVDRDRKNKSKQKRLLIAVSVARSCNRAMPVRRRRTIDGGNENFHGVTSRPGRAKSGFFTRGVAFPAKQRRRCDRRSLHKKRGAIQIAGERSYLSLFFGAR